MCLSVGVQGVCICLSADVHEYLNVGVESGVCLGCVSI